MHADALPNEFKKQHLSNLHFLIQKYASVIVNNAPAYNLSIPLLWLNNQTGHFEPGVQQLAFAYNSAANPALNVAFIENQAGICVTTMYNNVQYNMPPQSMSVIDASGNELWNSWKVPAPTMHRVNQTVSTGAYDWNFWVEPMTPHLPAGHFISDRLLVKPAVRTGMGPADQLSVTLDQTMYLWYQTSFFWSDNTDAGDVLYQLDGVAANAYMLYIDGVFDTSFENHEHDDRNITFNATSTLTLTAGSHTLTILSSTLGVDNGMSVGSTGKLKGIVGSVKIGPLDLTNQPWSMRPYLAGEVSQIFTPTGSRTVSWTSLNSFAGDFSAGTWFQTSFQVPLPSTAYFSVLMDLTFMGRGEAYINGNSIGRYFLIQGILAYGLCDQAGIFAVFCVLYHHCGHQTSILFSIL